jgi:hypothetical protein
VDELANRYEELTLVYSLDEHAKNLSEGLIGIRTLLAKFSEYFRADLAVYVTKETAAPVLAMNPRKPIENVDLVLIETRGNLFRFTEASKSTLVINGVDDDRRRFLFKDLPFKVLACPLTTGTCVDGMIALLRHYDEDDFTNSDRNLANVLVAQAGVLIRNRTILQQATALTEQIAASIVQAIEAKDCYTAGHSERVKTIALKLGIGLQLPSNDLQELYWAGLLHDVGKIAVPDVILTNPGRLTPDEYTLMKTHPERGYEILRHIDRLGEGALQGVRHHHERFEGEGYPHGLSGCAIPLPARIIAIADTYDAICTSRAYRPARSHDGAMEEIRRVSGNQLDPELVTLFDSMCAKDTRWLQELRATELSDG